MDRSDMSPETDGDRETLATFITFMRLSLPANAVLLGVNLQVIVERAPRLDHEVTEIALEIRSLLAVSVVDLGVDSELSLRPAVDVTVRAG